MTKARKRIKIIASRAVVYAVLTLFALWILAPFSIVLSISVKNWVEAERFGFTLWPQDGFDFSGFTKALGFKYFDAETPALLIGLKNTLIYVIPTVLIGLMMSSVAAYAFAKIRFRLKNAMFGALIAILLIPGTIMLAPAYMLYTTIGWVNTPLPLMIPGMFGTAACVFFMRQFYSGIPDALVEAAKLDGMGYWKIFFKIMIPLSVPALLAQGILGFVGGYNDYLGPLIYLQSRSDLFTLQITLNEFAGRFKLGSVNTLMAACVLVLIPTLIIYAVAQKYFIEGIATSGMKL